MAGATLIKSRGALQRFGGTCEFVDGNSISIPQLPDEVEWLAAFDVEILMLDGCARNGILEFTTHCTRCFSIK